MGFQNRLNTFLSGPSLSDSTKIPSQDYLIGIRGVLVFQSFLFVFFQAFLPAIVPDSKNTTGSLYQVVLRKSLGPIFWNESLIYSSVILLSARTLALPYLNDPQKEVCASSIFRRGLRLWIPTFIAFSLSAAAFSSSQPTYVSEFLSVTGNLSTIVPMRMRNFLVFFNSLYNLFWVTKWYSAQAANQAFPSGTLWMVSLLFQQSYTVYMTMVTIPHTRKSWRVKAFLAFILTAWWVQSWAWYSITGLLLADLVINMDFQLKSRSGFRVGKTTIPIWPLYTTMIFTGILLSYLFIAWRPDMRANELYGHTGLYNAASLNEDVDLNQPQARDDNYLVILGLMLLVETYQGVQNILRTKFLMAMGRRSFAIFLIQPLIIYTAGIKLYMHLHAASTSHELATFACFVVCLPLTAIASEIFYRLFDVPSHSVARELWAWVRK